MLAAFDPIPDAVQSSFSSRMVPAHDRPQGHVGHAFLLDLEHRPLELEEIFAASELFDLHEAALRRNLIVDVLEVTPTRTTLHLKPERAMTYCAIAAEVRAMVAEAAQRIPASGLRASRLQWVVEPVGIRTQVPDLVTA